MQKRDIRRAYYKKSIVWHPDKWASIGSSNRQSAGRDKRKDKKMEVSGLDSSSTSSVDVRLTENQKIPSPYTAIVQCIFELVGEAYRDLLKMHEDD